MGTEAALRSGRLKLVGAGLGVLALGVAIGLMGNPTSGVPAGANDDATSRKLDALEQQVHQLGAKGPLIVQAPANHGTLAQAAAAAPTPSPSTAALEPEAGPAPSDEQIAAGDRLVALADTIIQSGSLTAENRRALRGALAASDPERREATILTLVRAMNEQRLRTTEPGPPF